ncbi:lipase 3-like [Haematobia irritans]|uniref:lipase 3-like n=1 Tax=Haematobia irritans TaxID=7368 RepID=UPI003F4F9E56
MKYILSLFIIFIGCSFLIFSKLFDNRKSVSTCERISKHGYPCEAHTVQTNDGYLLTTYRIPYSPYTESKTLAHKPAVLMMHCLLCSSDIWVLNTRDNSLPFILADAGYDVWLANTRGNIYSQKHISLDPLLPEFWDFSLDEIGHYDVPANIDYITTQINQSGLHYVGYSQGTTVFLMMLASYPQYAMKVKTSHLLGPGVFLCHIKSPILFPIAYILGQPFAANYFTNVSTRASDEIIRALAPNTCKLPVVETLCRGTIGLMGGWGSPYMNWTLLNDFLQSIPAAGSMRQIMQYFQFISSCQFRYYNFDMEKNIARYGLPQSPSYNLENINLVEPINAYFSDNDFIMSPMDIEHLYEILDDRVLWYRVKYPKFNHFDFVLATNVAEVLYKCIMDKIDKYEGRSFNGNLCKHFKDKPF